MSVEPNELIDALYQANCEPRSYSGRAMFGERCVGIALDSDSELWRVAQSLASRDIFIGGPRTDSLGMGIIAYWPGVKWPEEAQ